VDTEWDGGPPERLVDAGSLKLLADRAQMNAQLGADLTECPTLGVGAGCMLNVHRGTVTSLSPCIRRVQVLRRSPVTPGEEECDEVPTCNLEAPRGCKESMRWPRKARGGSVVEPSGCDGGGHEYAV
jgi:hypothetical protein